MLNPVLMCRMALLKTTLKEKFFYALDNSFCQLPGTEEAKDAIPDLGLELDSVCYGICACIRQAWIVMNTEKQKSWG